MSDKVSHCDRRQSCDFFIHWNFHIRNLRGWIEQLCMSMISKRSFLSIDEWLTWISRPDFYHRIMSISCWWLLMITLDFRIFPGNFYDEFTISLYSERISRVARGWNQHWSHAFPFNHSNRRLSTRRVKISLAAVYSHSECPYHKMSLSNLQACSMIRWLLVSCSFADKMYLQLFYSNTTWPA